MTSTTETKQTDHQSIPNHETHGLRAMPTIVDWLCLVPPKLRDELAGIANKARFLETEKEKKNAIIEELKRRINVLIRTSPEFCKQFLQFLHKQNEELRTIALAGQGSYEEAAPPERASYTSYDPWIDGFKSTTVYDGVKYVLPSGPTDGAVAHAAAHIEGNISGYINEFTANIVRKGRRTQVIEFVKGFPLHPITESDIKIQRFKLFSVTSASYARTEYSRCFGIEKKQPTTRLDYFVHKFESDDAFRAKIMAKATEWSKPVPPDVRGNNTLLAIHVFTIELTDEERDGYGKEFEKWQQDHERSGEKEGAFREAAFDHLTGNERRDALRAAIQSHMERITWLTSQLTAQ